MGETMTFPETVEEFMEQYKIVDREQVYTNGAELVPIFRMKQWFEHEKAQLSCECTTSDLISRQWLMECVNEGWIKFDTEKDANRFIHLVRDIAPTIQPQSTAGQLNDGVRSTAQSTDLIDRQAAIDALQKCRKHCIDPFDSYHIDIQDAEYQLSKLPTIQSECRSRMEREP